MIYIPKVFPESWFFYNDSIGFIVRYIGGKIKNCEIIISEIERYNA